jgi:putative transposase
MKNKIYRNDDTVLRVLSEKGGSVLVIDCVKKSMPKWITTAAISNFVECSEIELLSLTSMVIPDIDSLDASSKEFMHKHFTMIAGILPFVGDEKQRSYLVDAISKEMNIGKQTIRKTLCLYLVYQNIAVLTPKQKNYERELTTDEKNIRWALNKFFYNKNRNSLTTAYTMMLKEKYCDSAGVLLPEYPSIHQFKYFYRKHKNMQTFYISRDGLKNYQRNNRPLLGDGVQEFAPNVGSAMLDATICDIYLVDDAGNLVGRPILVACIDAYSSLCMGYSLLWEGGVYSLRNLMLNVIADKVSWCKEFGILISREDWNSDKLPGTLVTDMGSEYKSENFEQISELGVTIINLPAYRPELKGSVEKFFDLIQDSFKPLLKGKGVIEPDYKERGAHDYRKDACLTMHDFETIILRCIIYYNSKRIIENYPYTDEMIAANIKPFATSIFEWGLSVIGCDLLEVNRKELLLTLLPRAKGKFSRFGLRVNKMRYHREGYTEQYLKGTTVTVAYNPDDVSAVWLIENGEYIEFNLIESRYKNKTIEGVEQLQSDHKSLVKGVIDDNLQAQINLARHIQTIANKASTSPDVNIMGIRSTRKREQNKTHTDLMKGSAVNE